MWHQIVPFLGLFVSHVKFPTFPSIQVKENPHRSFTNPILPGWHPDPSCDRVKDTYYCTFSSSLTFPGLPVYASKDLVNWKLVSHAWHKESQLPSLSWSTPFNQAGMTAPTLRHHKGTWYIITQYVTGEGNPKGLIFRSQDPFDPESWRDPITFYPEASDPDIIFTHNNNRAYVASSGVILQGLDLMGGTLGTPTQLWRGERGIAERPHIYRHWLFNWWYFLIVTEGSGYEQTVSMARAESIHGPWERVDRNPLFGSNGTNLFFQSVGRSDIIKAAESDPLGRRYYGVAQAIRSGPPHAHDGAVHHPMGAETVLYPINWTRGPIGHFPFMGFIRGIMERQRDLLLWGKFTRDRKKDRTLLSDFDPLDDTGEGVKLPEENLNLPGDQPMNHFEDRYDFHPDEPIPRNLIYWRVPAPGAIAVAHADREARSWIDPVKRAIPSVTTTVFWNPPVPATPSTATAPSNATASPNATATLDSKPRDFNGLRVVPSRANLTGVLSVPADNELNGQSGQSFIGRIQSHSLFDFSVESDVEGEADPNLEYGVSVFIGQMNHLDLSVIGPGHKGCAERCIRLSGESEGTVVAGVEETIVEVPKAWESRIKLEIRADHPYNYTFTASPPDIAEGHPHPQQPLYIGAISSAAVSRGTAGAILGVYATCNGAGSGVTCPEGGASIFRNWKYTGKAQLVGTPREDMTAD